MAKKRNLKSYLDALVDDKGLKTEVKVTLTDQTMIKIIAAFVGSGITVLLVAHTFKHLFPNPQLQNIQKSLDQLVKK